MELALICMYLLLAFSMDKFDYGHRALRCFLQVPRIFHKNSMGKNGLLGRSKSKELYFGKGKEMKR